MADISITETVEYEETFKNIFEPISSRHSNTTLIEDSGEVFRNTYELKDLSERSDDLYTQVKGKEVGRLDLVALRMYNDPKLYWIIAEANDIIDPFTEVIEGLALRIPKVVNGVAV